MAREVVTTCITARNSVEGLVLRRAEMKLGWLAVLTYRRMTSLAPVGGRWEKKDGWIWFLMNEAT